MAPLAPCRAGSLGVWPCSGCRRRRAPRGRPRPTDPVTGSAGPRRYVRTFGHRNLQDLARRREDTLWSVEHGPCRHEVDLLSFDRHGILTRVCAPAALR